MIIMVVDDDPELREVMGLMLRDAGFEVLLAADGEEALALTRQGHVPDLILLDVEMPVMDGWHFLSARLTDPVLAATPVILTSALPEHVEHARVLASDFLPKPIRTDQLIAAIAHCRRMLAQIDDEAERLHASAAASRRVLVVDDDPDTREALVDALVHEGFEAETAAHGREAMALLRTRLAEAALPSVIVCDLRMPVMDGWRLWQELRQDRYLGAIPLILMSGHAYELNKLDSDVTGLMKPVDLDELLSAIRSVIAAP